jgi:hypothetical protein
MDSPSRRGEPALQIATEFVRIAVAGLDMKWTPDVEFELTRRGLNLADLHNVLAFCEVKRSNKSEAEGVFLEVIGTTTEDLPLSVKVWVNMDQGFFRVEEVF